VSLVAGEGRFVSLVGPSGSGKSSLLRAVIGLQQPLSGAVDTELARSQVGILFQDDALLPWKTARDNVALGLIFNGMDRSKARVEADAWLERLDLVGFGDQFPRRLSGGQRKRVALAQVLAMKPKLILMDEPTMGLDPKARHLIFELIRELNDDGHTLLLVEQNARAGLAIAHHGAVLDGGRVALSGPGPTLLEDPRVAELYLGGAPREEPAGEARTRPGWTPARPSSASSPPLP
jgi:NitT/TauT family transport system ATP-binding protein